MAATLILPTYSPLHGSVVVISDSDENDMDLNANTVIYAVEVDNRNNAAASYTKIYDASDPTVGGESPDDPDVVLMTPANSRVLHILNGTTGYDPATNTTVVTVTTPGSGGSTGPTSPVIVRLFIA